MRQNELSPAPGSRWNRKRVGRGDGSGYGTYSVVVPKGRNLALVIECAPVLRVGSCH